MTRFFTYDQNNSGGVFDLTDDLRFKVHYSDGAFEEITFMGDTYKDWVYRTVPLPLTQDVIAWEKLPDWVETVMRDENGKVFASYTNYPLNGSGIRIDDFPGIVQIGTVDWKESKMRRPRNAE
jgi:hypothetical protein